MGKSQKRCHSCRKLRIACNQERPACEYCQSTGRQCVYADQEPSPTALDLSANLNSPTSQLNVSAFEFRLLQYFHEFGLKDERYQDLNNLEPVENIWRNEVTQLWQSEAVRKCIYLVSSTYLWNGNRLAAAMVEGSRGDVDTARDLMRQKTMQYFAESMADIMTTLQQVNVGLLLTRRGAAELAVSSVLLFAFLALQPFGYIKLLSFDSDLTDLIRFCRALREPFLNVMPLLAGTGYEPLFGAVSFEDKVDLTTHVPVLKRLVAAFHALDASTYTRGQMTAMRDGLSELIEAVHHLMASNPRPFTNWLLVVQVACYDLMLHKDYFCLQLLFCYSAFAVKCGFRLSFRATCFLQYMADFKNHSVRLQKWHDHDEAFYRDVITSLAPEISKAQAAGMEFALCQ